MTMLEEANFGVVGGLVLTTGGTDVVLETVSTPQD